MIENAPQVLLALPSEEAAKSIAAQLRRCDMNCCIATSMEDLNSAISTQSISLALVGMRFDGRCGLEFCRRKRELLRQVLVVMVADDSTPSTESVVNAMKSGAEDVLVPPYDPMQIRQLVSLSQRRFSKAVAAEVDLEDEFDEDERPDCGSRAQGSTESSQVISRDESTRAYGVNGSVESSSIDRPANRITHAYSEQDRHSDVKDRLGTKDGSCSDGTRPYELRGRIQAGETDAYLRSENRSSSSGQGSLMRSDAHSDRAQTRSSESASRQEGSLSRGEYSRVDIDSPSGETQPASSRRPRPAKEPLRIPSDYDGPNIGMGRDEQLARLESMLIGHSRALEQVRQAIVDVADTTAAVMITGESGTGKELVANAIHQLSLRADGPFVPVNMAAIPQGLAESLLFGHEKGAFTNAISSQTGWCESADQGTLFLDEIGEMELAVQPKLLRFLQEGTVHPVGARQLKRVDVRIITATNRAPEAIVRERILREDLYFRLHVVPIHLPPLRERREDIGPLANLFLQRAAQRHRRAVERFSNAALAELEAAAWPGNIRQLENLVERMVIFARNAEIQPSDFPMDFHSVTSQISGGTFGDSLNASMDMIDDDHEALTLMEQKERDAIMQALERCGGHVVAAAGILGIGQATLYRKLKRYRIDRKRLQVNSGIR